MSNIEYVSCNLCGKDEYTVLYDGYPTEDPTLFSSSGNDISTDRIVKCAQCGLIYVNPRLKEGLVLQGYSEGTDETFISQKRGREGTFEKSLMFIERFAPPGKILDVGAAGGSFLNVARNRGWETYGVEPNAWLCAWAKKEYGLDVRQGTLFTARFPPASFDAISMWDVLEHVHDPMKHVHEASRLLKPGGLLIINYPDIGSAVARLMRRRWVFLLAVHIYYFTPPTLAAMLRKAGFAPLSISHHYQRLDLGYLALRMEPYSKVVSHVLSAFFNSSGLGRLLIPYWMGQNLLLARKL